MPLPHPPSVCPAAPSCPVSHGSPRAEAFDPFGPEYQVDPAETLRWSREEEPVFYSRRLGYWVVTRYDDVRAIFRDHETFSPAIALEKITPTGPEAEAVLKKYDFALNRTLVNEDEPAHMPRRRALMGPFAPEALREREDMVRRLARDAVDRFVDDGHADLVPQMLYDVPLTVALHFLGVPEADVAPLKDFSVAHTVNTWGRPAPEEQVAVAEGVGRFWQYAGEVLGRIRADPDRPGWMPFSVRAQAQQPDVVTDSYLHSMMMAGVVAAHETTAHASANMVKLLLENRAVWDEICANPQLVPGAVEECLRHAGSVAAWRRLVTRDTTIGGVEVPAGAKLLIASSSANHDPRRFDDPDAIDIRRADADDHLTFGYGVHQCLGKNLARMEMQVFLHELTTRLPHLRLAEQEFTYVPNTSFRGPEHLLVEWDPAANPERADPSVLDRTPAVTIGEPAKSSLSRELTVKGKRSLTPDVVEIRLTPADGGALPKWTSGAHIDLDCGLDDSGEPRSRQYSLCGEPGTPEWCIAVAREVDGRGGSAWVHSELRAGATVTVRGPRNHFRLDEGDGHLVLIAGGIGITPILAHADAARTAGRSYEVHYLGRSRATMAYLDRALADHGDRAFLHVGDEGGRADLSALLADLPPGGLVYACGPQRLLDALTDLAERAPSAYGWPQDTLRLEHFTSTLVELDPTVEHAFDVELAVSGQTVRVAPDTTLLSALRTAGIDVPSDCEEGLCGTCEVGVVDGEVDHRDVVLTSAERAAHRCLMTCCSRAVGDRLVLDL